MNGVGQTGQIRDQLPRYTRGTKSENRINNMTHTYRTERWGRGQRDAEAEKEEEEEICPSPVSWTERQKQQWWSRDVSYAPPPGRSVSAHKHRGKPALTEHVVLENVECLLFPSSHIYIHMYCVLVYDKNGVPLLAREGLVHGGGGALCLFRLRDESVDETRLSTPWTHTHTHKCSRCICGFKNH